MPGPSRSDQAAYKYWRMAANASKLVQPGETLLHAVSISTKGTTANTLTLYDGIDNTGALLGVIDTTAQPGQLVYDIVCAVGLYAVLGTGVAADLLIEYL